MMRTCHPQKVHTPIAYAVTKKGWAPPSIYPSDAFRPENLAHRFKVPAVHLRVDLSSAFDQVQRRHRRVSRPLESHE